MTSSCFWYFSSDSGWCSISFGQSTSCTFLRFASHWFYIDLAFHVYHGVPNPSIQFPLFLLSAIHKVPYMKHSFCATVSSWFAIQERHLSKGACLPLTDDINSQGFYSLSGRKPYRQISLNLETARLDVITILSLWNLTGISAALLPRCLFNFRAIGQG